MAFEQEDIFVLGSEPSWRSLIPRTAEAKRGGRGYKQTSGRESCSRSKKLDGERSEGEEQEVEREGQKVRTFVHGYK